MIWLNTQDLVLGVFGVPNSYGRYEKAQRISHVFPTNYVGNTWEISFISLYMEKSL
jgi:hypothetical protein